MAEKCTKTSSPVERWIKPYPLAPLNHFTVPFSLTEETPFAYTKIHPPSFRGEILPLKGCGRSLMPGQCRTRDSTRKAPEFDAVREERTAQSSGACQGGASFDFGNQHQIPTYDRTLPQECGNGRE